MSKKRAIQKSAQQQAQAQAIPPVVRGAFSIVIAFDPSRPLIANVNVMPVGGDGNGGAHIDDVVTALRMGYEQALTQRGMWLAEMQRAQAAEAAAAEN